MAIRRILTDRDPALHKKCHPVTNFDGRLHNLLDDLRQTLAEANGYGLAAPQIGILRRVALVTNANDEVVELINPSVIHVSGETEEDWEGCLSVAGMYGKVSRPCTVRVRAQDRTGKEFEVEETGMPARCLCHEIDHLDGRVYTKLVNGRLYTAKEVEDMLEREADKA